MNFLSQLFDNSISYYISGLHLNYRLGGALLVGTLFGIFISPYLKIRRSPGKFVKGRLNYKNKPLKDAFHNSSSESDGIATDEDANCVENSEPCKMVLVVRNDLKMGKGKAAAQYLDIWELEGQAKVTLKCESEEEMLRIQAKAIEADVPNRSIIDAGRTQLEPNTRTVLGIGPAPISVIDELTGHLKLY